MTTSAPTGSIVPTNQELSVLHLPQPECPDCGGPVSKNCRSFSPTHPSVDDDHRYPRAVTQLAASVDVLTDSSLENRQDLLTIYDELLRAPVAESIADRCTKDTVREFLTTALTEKPVHVVTTDGRSDYPEIIEEDLDAFHHRCRFHFIKNGEKKLRNTVFESVRYTHTERLRGAIVWSEFKRVFAEPSYAAAVRRFEAVLDKIEHLPKELRTPVEEVMENFDTFLGHLRHEAVPSMTNNLERYYEHTKPTQIKRRFRSDNHAQAFLKQQMRLRTLKQGLISRERSLSLGRELFPAMSMEQLEPLFTESK